MHGADGPGQARIGQARHGTRVHQPLGHRVAQQLDQQHLDEAVHHRGMAAAGGQYLGKQQLLGGLQARQLRHRHPQQRGQAAQQRVLVTGAEVNLGADQLGALGRRGRHPVRHRPRQEEQAGLDQQTVLALRPGQPQRPAPQQVQMADAGLGLEHQLLVQHAAHDQP